MNADSQDSESVVPPPSTVSRLALPLVLAILLGVLLALGAVGGYLHVRQVSDFNAEARDFDKSLKEKNDTIAQLQDQIQALSSQVHTLRGYAVARSKAPVEQKESAGEAKASSSAASVPLGEANRSTDSAKPVVANDKAAPRALTTKPKEQNCDLVGKSPDEQVETLRRCVQLIDPPPSKLRSR